MLLAMTSDERVLEFYKYWKRWGADFFLHCVCVCVCMCLQWRIQDFPEEGALTPKGAPTYFLANFSRKTA